MQKENLNLDDLVNYLREIEASLGIIFERERDINVIIRNMLAYYEVSRFIRFIYASHCRGVLEPEMLSYVVLLKSRIIRRMVQSRDYFSKGELYYLPERVYFEIYPFHRLIYLVPKAPKTTNSKRIREALLSLHPLLMQRWNYYSFPNEDILWMIAVILACGNRKLHSNLVSYIQGFVNSKNGIEGKNYDLFYDILYCMSCKALKRKPIINCSKWL